MNKVPVVFAFDNNLIFPACVCISSLMMNAKSDTFYDIFILHSHKIELDKAELDKIPRFFPNCQIQYRQIDDTFDSAFEIRGITIVTYYRLLIPKLIPEYDAVIYSDVDVIFREDLSALYNSTKMEDFYVAGVNNLAHIFTGLGDYYEKVLGLDRHGIICGGFLIINSLKLLKDNKIPEFLDLAKKKFTFQDQDILNISCKGKIKYLAPCHSVLTYINEAIVYHRKDLLCMWTEEELNTALTKGNIHYNGQKPWRGFCVNFDVWWEYYRKSPFYDERFYFDFFYNKLNMLDQLSLWKRVKILVRYFVYGRK